ncbi:MAG TPA: ABC transporter ATP-binding protein [Thermotoga sp.]|uniref:Oligopeptide ABC transporter, ATP-binding protein n=2 Tax=Thermotoga TaxID=2335 RepID=Q9X0U7_THEMA|nr:ABC transporter ATP-binding protein [Thermotoga maritima]ABQ47556.1 oligopeptide/dipeptide ABC transporter, ATPase subunit [Thermotoga petrophila RKU-1]ACB09934.1 oligopeptide/dipeptide ABC transporter, ATPase subunit [Thermotoga sp. RQ2]HBF70070.1 ABC transporter ATP-binding protein [Thermotoga sp.]AAD36295.1 oligopeptide ABC transporter, ATP-binding protein [Thermotoga maritima MSB8]AKE27131.1 peptide ABC transporter ATPase [Thermotoga maritima]
MIGVAEVVLDVRDLRIYYRTLYGYVKAVDGVSFDIKRGEILGIAGESGCGKSTLGNGLILLKPPMKYMGGEAILDGKNIMALSPKELRKVRYEKISIIPQYAMDAMNPTKKIKQIIDDLLHEHGESFERKKDVIEERLEIVNLGKKVLNMYPIELSGGMKQRMVMVISTLMNPDVLIADEITSALDVSSQRSVIQMLYEMREKEIMGSLAFITHDLSVLYQIADKVMVLYAGRVAEISPMEDIIQEPLHPYTKMLLSSLPKIGVRYSQTKLKGIPGYPPSLLNIGPGCRFRDRCPYAFEKCEQDPPVFDVDGRKVSCWLFERGDAN